MPTSRTPRSPDAFPLAKWVLARPPSYGAPDADSAAIVLELDLVEREEIAVTVRLRAISMDCRDAHALASFYAEVMDMPTRYTDTAELLQMHDRVSDSPGWVVIKRADGQCPGLSFGGADGKPPVWQDRERPRRPSWTLRPTTSLRPSRWFLGWGYQAAFSAGGR